MFLRFIKNYWLILFFGGVILYYDLKLFILFGLIIFCLSLDRLFEHLTDYHNAIISNQILIDRKIRAIVRHLKIGDKEKERILKEATTETSIDNWERLKNDFHNLD